MPRPLLWPCGGARFLMSEVPLHLAEVTLYGDAGFEFRNLGFGIGVSVGIGHPRVGPRGFEFPFRSRAESFNFREPPKDP